MVINHNFRDIFNCVNENEVLNLPPLKENGINIKFTNSQEHKTVYANAKEPPLPFAASEIFYAPINKWRRLTALHKDCKAVYELSLDIQVSNFSFKPGDTIGIIPQNCQSEVNTLIDHLKIKDVADTCYTLSIEKGAKIPAYIPVQSTFRHVLTHCVDLRGVLKKLFLLALSRYTTDKIEKKVLEYLCSKEGSIAYTTHILNKGTNLIDLLTIFKMCQPPVEIILQHLPRLLPRPYSIVNSSHSNEKNIKICFSIMDIGNNRKGLTTGWLEDIFLIENNIEEKMKALNLKNDKIKIPIYLRKNLNGFYCNEDITTPVIMIGPGTGVSPYIGFLEEREYLSKVNVDRKLGYSWVFFGCRNPKLDFIYEEELNYFISRNILDKLTTSFSRCGNTESCYVQNAITQNGDQVAKLILQGAHVYVCGDVNKMAAAVREALVNCLTKYGGKTADEAETFVSDMQKDKKYLIDIWN